ncbi:MAG: hypothetical protein LBN09_04890 [Clostridioides sp.]|nr:hypothetical protein [Clostridioides sp.]
MEIFKCIGNDSSGVPQSMLDNLGIDFEDANKEALKMAELSKEISKEMDMLYCVVPFCHTTESEAFGSKVVFDAKAGNRIRTPWITTKEDLDKIEKVDISKGRIHEVIEAIKILKEQGEKVCLDVTGPITVATSVVDNNLFYKLVRKDRSAIEKLLEIVEDCTIRYIESAVEAGVDLISFADPAGTFDLVGPKVYREVAGPATMNIFEAVKDKLGDAVVHVCGKTSTSLEEVELLSSQKIPVVGDRYTESIENYRVSLKKGVGLDLCLGSGKFIGHWCIQRNRKDDCVVRLDRWVRS